MKRWEKIGEGLTKQAKVLSHTQFKALKSQRLEKMSQIRASEKSNFKSHVLYK